MHRSLAMCSTLALSILFGLQGALADPPTSKASLNEGNNSIRALLKYLWPVLSSTGKTGRVYYRALTCPPNDDYEPLWFPKITVRQPAVTGGDLSVARSIFRGDDGVSVTEDGTGMLRIRVGKVPDTILQTPIPKLSFDAAGQYNFLLAIDAIENAPEVRTAMNRLHLRVPARVNNFLVVQPGEGLPHLPSEISNVTMDQALDMVAKTWAGVIFYGACSMPATYEVFFADSPYFRGASY